MSKDFILGNWHMAEPCFDNKKPEEVIYLKTIMSMHHVLSDQCPKRPFSQQIHA